MNNKASKNLIHQYFNFMGREVRDGHEELKPLEWYKQIIYEQVVEDGVRPCRDLDRCITKWYNRTFIHWVLRPEWKQYLARVEKETHNLFNEWVCLIAALRIDEEVSFGRVKEGLLKEFRHEAISAARRHGNEAMKKSAIGPLMVDHYAVRLNNIYNGRNDKLPNKCDEETVARWHIPHSVVEK